MFKKFASAAICVAAATPCLAAHWLGFSKVGSDSVIPFIDADTFGKRGPIATFWIQYVHNPSTLAAGDSYVVTVKQAYNCAKRTSESLTATHYGKGGIVLFTNATPTAATEVVPDSLAEGILEVVCKPGFPTKAANDSYTPVAGNDPVAEAHMLFQRIDAWKARSGASAPNGTLN